MTAWGCVTARPLFYAPIVVVYISKSLFYDMWFNGYICRCTALCGCIAACSVVFGTLYS